MSNGGAFAASGSEIMTRYRCLSEGFDAAAAEGHVQGAVRTEHRPPAGGAVEATSIAQLALPVDGVQRSARAHQQRGVLGVDRDRPGRAVDAAPPALVARAVEAHHLAVAQA